MIPLNERHLRGILREWIAHYNYNKDRPHSSLGPGIPEAPADLRKQEYLRHRIPEDRRVARKPILDGLHHEYRLEKIAA